MFNFEMTQNVLVNMLTVVYVGVAVLCWFKVSMMRLPVQPNLNQGEEKPTGDNIQNIMRAAYKHKERISESPGRDRFLKSITSHQSGDVPSEQAFLSNRTEDHTRDDTLKSLVKRDTRLDYKNTSPSQVSSASNYGTSTRMKIQSFTPEPGHMWNFTESPHGLNSTSGILNTSGSPDVNRSTVPGHLPKDVDMDEASITNVIASAKPSRDVNGTKPFNGTTTSQHQQNFTMNNIGFNAIWGLNDFNNRPNNTGHSLNNVLLRFRRVTNSSTFEAPNTTEFNINFTSINSNTLFTSPPSHWNITTPTPDATTVNDTTIMVNNTNWNGTSDVNCTFPINGTDFHNTTGTNLTDTNPINGTCFINDTDTTTPVNSNTSTEFPTWTTTFNSSTFTFSLTDENGMFPTLNPTRQAVWPSGGYGLAVPNDQCPDPVNFTKRSVLPGKPENNILEKLNMTICDHQLPSGQAIDSNVMWEYGQYCVFSGNVDGICPDILQLENITVHTALNMAQDTLLYCCVNATPTYPLTLPSTESFYLLPIKEQNCATVVGMFSSIQSRTVNVSNITHVTSSNNAPAYSRSGEYITFHLCHYQSIPNYTPNNTDTAPTRETTNDTTIVEDVTDNGIPLEVILGPACASGLLVIIIIVVVVVIILRKRKRAIPPDVSAIELRNEDEPSSTKVTKAVKPLELGRVLTMILDPETQLTIYNLLLHPDKVEIEDKIGKGAFGNVYYGRYKPDANPLHAKEVAIKTLKENCGYSDINGFMNEALVMADFNHPNVLGLTGVCVQEGTEIPIIVLPYMEHGDLQTYLRHFRYDEDKMNKAPDFPQLLCFCLHIARGMNYLAQMKFVHRDLAARNCMLNGNMVAKVADFGLTRDIYCSSYYRQDRNKLLPIKWMALESLQDRVFTTYSDIWSYGVTVWEIFTLGKVPYPDLENYQVIGFLENGGRLAKPEVSTDGLYQLLLRCWDVDPKSRPHFVDIAKELEDTLTGLCGYLDLEDDVTSPPITPTSRNPVRVSYLSEGEDTNVPSSVELMIPRVGPSLYGDYREIVKK